MDNLVKGASQLLYACNMYSTWEWRGDNERVLDYYMHNAIEAKNLLNQAKVANAALDTVLGTLAKAKLYPKEIQTDTIKLLHHTVKGIWLDLENNA